MMKIVGKLRAMAFRVFHFHLIVIETIATTRFLASRIHFIRIERIEFSFSLYEYIL